MTACEMVRHCEVRSNPVFGARNSGLLRFARNDGAQGALKLLTHAPLVWRDRALSAIWEMPDLCFIYASPNPGFWVGFRRVRSGKFFQIPVGFYLVLHLLLLIYSYSRYHLHYVL